MTPPFFSANIMYSLYTENRGIIMPNFHKFFEKMKESSFKIQKKPF